MKNALNYLNTKHNMLAWQNKKIKLDKIHFYILIILICFCLVIYFMVLTNPFNLENILKEFYPASASGSGNTETGGGGQNPTPGSGASVLGHNPNSDLNETFKNSRLQGNKATEEHNIEDNLVAEQHMTQDNLVAE